MKLRLGVGYSEGWRDKSCHKYYKVKNAPKNIFDDTSMKSIHIFRKKCWKENIFFESQPFLALK